jgi:hypothetical protein
MLELKTLLIIQFGLKLFIYWNEKKGLSALGWLIKN